MTISIIGLGHVGCVNMGCLAKDGYSIIGVDVDASKVAQVNCGRISIFESKLNRLIQQQWQLGRISATTDCKKAIRDSELTIITVGSESTKSGTLNLDAIYQVAKTIGVALRVKKGFHIVSIRSTVIPGTAERAIKIIGNSSHKKSGIDFAVVSNPEFLREGTSVDDYFSPSFVVIGANNNRAARAVAKLYHNISVEIFFTTHKEAELLKLVCNTFHALKVVFANEIGNICRVQGVNARSLMDIFCKDRYLNISAQYLKPGFAYGGPCLSKDTRALQSISRALNLDSSVIQSIERSNRYQVSRTLAAIKSFKKKKIGFLGLTFKVGTDDLRGSPVISLINELSKSKYSILAYDRRVKLAGLSQSSHQYLQKFMPNYQDVITANINSLLEWAQVVVVAHKDNLYVEKLKKTKDKIIIDLVEIGGEISQSGNYYGINW